MRTALFLATAVLLASLASPTLAQGGIEDFDGQWDGVACFVDPTSSKATRAILLEIEIAQGDPQDPRLHKAHLEFLTDWSGSIHSMASFGVAMASNGYYGVVLGAGEEAPGQQRTAIIRVSADAASPKTGLFRFRNEYTKQWTSLPTALTLYRKGGDFPAFVANHKQDCAG